MNLRFNVYLETGLPHIYNRGVAEYEVQDVLDDPGLAPPAAEAALQPTILKIPQSGKS